MEVGTIDTALGLVAAGADVLVYAEPGVTLPPRARSLADRVVTLAALPAPLRGARPADAAFLAVKLLLSRRWEAAWREHPTDVLHATSPGTAALVGRHVPTAVQSWFHPHTLRGRWATMLQFAPRAPHVYAANVVREAQAFAADDLGYRAASCVLANTPTAQRFLTARGYPAQLVPPPIEMPGELPAREADEAFRIVFCGSPVGRPRKGLRYLLEAVAACRHRPLRLTLVGRWDEEMEGPVAAARRAGVVVETPGHVQRSEYLDLLAHSTDLLAFPSLYEEWGYALFEALSRGVPAVAFDLYPFHDIIDADSGLLVAPKDVAALAGAIDAAAAGAIASPAAVLESTRRRFGSVAVAEQLLGVYEQMAR
jgi:glycosyltransferase involved in cell wall biosynthesis